jgi:hypothetical protein
MNIPSNDVSFWKRYVVTSTLRNPELGRVSPHYDFVSDGEDGRPYRRETTAEGPALYLFPWIGLY